jgi:hypothetical protein
MLWIPLKKRGDSGRARTLVPMPGRDQSRPSSLSSRKAWRTVWRLTL